MLRLEDAGMFLLYRTPSGMQLAKQQALRDVSLSIDEVFRSSDPLNLLQQAWEKGVASA